MLYEPESHLGVFRLRSDEARVRKIDVGLASDFAWAEFLSHARHPFEQLQAAELEWLGKARGKPTVRVCTAHLVGAQVLVDRVGEAFATFPLVQPALGLHTALHPKTHWHHQIFNARDSRRDVWAVAALTLAAAPEPAELILPLPERHHFECDWCSNFDATQLEPDFGCIGPNEWHPTV